MNDAAKSAACAPKVKYGECKKKWHGTPFYNGVGWVDKPNVSDGLWICWVDNPTYPPYHFFMHFTIGISDGLQDSINLHPMPCTIHAYDYTAKKRGVRTNGAALYWAAVFAVATDIRYYKAFNLTKQCRLKKVSDNIVLCHAYDYALF